jgi:hypothetical protein
MFDVQMCDAGIKEVTRLPLFAYIEDGESAETT